MIQANELRIGNKLLFTDSPHQGIRTIDGNDIAYAEKHPDWLRAFFQGVPITEKWLLKFGFRESETDLRKGNIIVRFGEDRLIITIIDVLVLPKMQYIHQLQNLYFAHHNQELTLQDA